MAYMKYSTTTETLWVSKEFLAWLSRGHDFVSLAGGYGLPGHRVTNQNDSGDSFRATISSGAPSLLQLEVEPGNSGMFEQ
jgi:thiamine pyrophosphate-dependent acetolactate synthase large subunit-like protein